MTCIMDTLVIALMICAAVANAGVVSKSEGNPGSSGESDVRVTMKDDGTAVVYFPPLSASGEYLSSSSGPAAGGSPTPKEADGSPAVPEGSRRPAAAASVVALDDGFDEDGNAIPDALNSAPLFYKDDGARVLRRTPKKIRAPRFIFH